MDRSRLLGCFLLLAGCHAQAGFTPDKSASALSGAQCKTTPGQAEIDLMGADASVRAKVASSRAAGPMVVEIKGDGCSSELKVLQCTVVGARLASYAPVTNRTSTIAKDPTELLSNQPVSTTSLMKEVSGQAAVRTDAEMVGVQRLNGIDGMKPIELAGPECSRATHVVSGIYLGGFTMAAGDPRELEKAPRIFGAGAKVAGHAKTLRSEGDASACATALREGKENNACAVPLRLALVSLAERKAMSKQVVEVAMPVDTGVRKSPVDRVPDVALGESGTELAGMTIRVIHTKARTNDADRAAARLQAHGATPQMYEVGDTGNEKYLGVVFLKTAYRDRFPVIASLLQDIEVLTPTIGDDYSYSDGQHVNLWIAK